MADQPATPNPTPPQLGRERKTIVAMIRLYCRMQHASEGAAPCDDCRQLEDYALARLDRCPFGESKPTCARCPIHCYKPAMRERIRAVMRFSGPRMMLRHPLLALRHQIDSIRSSTERDVPPSQRTAGR